MSPSSAATPTAIGSSKTWAAVAGAVAAGLRWEAKAERLVREELARQGGTEADLGRRRKGDPGKVGIARRLRAETTMTVAWIAQRLRMGVWTQVSNLLASRPKKGMGIGRKCICVNSED